MSIKILLVEDHELTRKGIAYSLKTFPDIEIIGDVDNGKKAVDFISSKKTGCNPHGHRHACYERY